MKKILVLSLILNTVYPGFVMAVSSNKKNDSSSNNFGSLFKKDNLISNEENFKKEVIKGLDNKLLKAIDEVKNSCTGIKKDYDLVFGLNVASAVSSGVGTGLAAGALATGIIKAKRDKDIEKQEQFLYKYGSCESFAPFRRKEFDGQDFQGKVAMLYEYLDCIGRKDAAIKRLQEDTKKSKKLGNIRTGLMAGATATSFTSMGTSIASVVNIRKMAEKMGNCNQALYDLKVVKVQLMAEMDSEDENKPEVKAAHTNVAKTEKILSSCKQFDGEMLKKLHSQSVATATVSGVGGVVGLAGTITSAIANSNKVRNDNTDKGKKKEKALNLMSNISAGVVTGTSAASTIISSISADVAKKESKKAGECEDILNSI